MGQTAGWRVMGCWAAIVILLSSVHATAETPREGAKRHLVKRQQTAAKAHAKRWFGSSLTWRNIGATRSFDRGYEPFYDPYFAMALSARLRYRPHPKLVLGLDLDLEREFTHSNWTTLAGETRLSNLRLQVSSPALGTIPGIGVRFGTGLLVTLPTSKQAQYQTLYAGLSPYISLSRRIKVLSGLTLGYRLAFSAILHAATTSRISSEGLTRCGIAATSAASLASTSCLSSGRRNAEVRLVNSFSLGFDFIPELGIGISVSTIHDFLYPSVDAVETYADAAADAVAPSDIRYYMAYDVHLIGRPWGPLAITLGLSTMNPQRKPNATDIYTPFFNRYTHLYLDVRLDVAKLVAEALR